MQLLHRIILVFFNTLKINNAFWRNNISSIQKHAKLNETCTTCTMLDGNTKQERYEGYKERKLTV